MKQYLLFILFVALSYNIGFGKPCVDLLKQKQNLEKVITDIDNKSSDKAKLQQLVILFKSCVTPEELKNIKNTYLSLTFDSDQQKKYKSIITKILDENKLLCVNFKNNEQQGINKDYIADLDFLITEYEKLKKAKEQEQENKYAGSATEKNYTVFNKIKSLLSDCVDGATLKEIQDLNNSVITENFGSVTTYFNANLRELININSDLLQVQNIAPTIPKTPVVEEIEEVEPEKSNFWTYMLYTLLLISILGNGYLLYKKNFGNFTNKLFFNKSKKEEFKSETNDYSQIQKSKINKLEEKVTSLKRTLEERDTEIKNLKNPSKNNKTAELDKVTVNRDVQNNSEATSIELEVTQPKNDNIKPYKKNTKEKNTPIIPKEVLYFAAPTLQREFMAKNGQAEVKNGASIYRFEVSGQTATFEFFNHPSTFKATINDPNNRIKPVCDILNAYNPDATKIETTTPGTAFLEGDKWKVKDNAKITYVM